MAWFIWNIKGIIFILIFYSAMLQTLFSTIRVSYIIESHFLYYLNCIMCILWLTLAIYSHLLCVFSDPGSISLHYKADFERFPVISCQMESTLNSELRDIIEKNCNTCNCAQPPRTYHCPRCERCIARLSHHCDWVNNCIGYYTERCYLLFLLYSILFSVQAILVFAIAILYGEFDLLERLEDSLMSTLIYNN